MDELGFDIGGLLSEEEAEQLFEEQAVSEKDGTPEETNEEKPAEEAEETEAPEEVGEEDNKEDRSNAAVQEGDGSSPSIYSSIASALKNDGIFPDFDDDELGSVQSPEDFAELFEKAITSKLDERQRRIDAALGNGVAPDTVKMYEQTLQYLGSINEEVLSAEGQDGEDLRRQLIYNDLINRGYSDEKARKEVDKSFKSGSDVEDAKDALESLNDFYGNGYKKVQEDAKKQAEEFRAAQKKQTEDFKKLVLDDDVKIGDVSLDKTTKQRVFDAVSKPVFKDKDTGKLLTAVQKFQKEQPLEFLKQLGMWYVLTDGGKSMDGFTKEQVRKEKNRAIKELGRKINTSSIGRDGSLRYVSGSDGGSGDPILSDGWKVGWGDTNI